MPLYGLPEIALTGVVQGLRQGIIPVSIASINLATIRSYDLCMALPPVVELEATTIYLEAISWRQIPRGWCAQILTESVDFHLPESVPGI